MDKEILLKIYHYKIPCIGESAQLCFKIEKDNGEPEFFYDEIEGFNYEWGYNYTISVEKKQIKNPMHDASSFTYKLKKILHKEKVSTEVTFELPLKIDDQSFIENKKGICFLLGKIEIQQGAYSCEDLSKAQSAVFKHGVGKFGLVLVKVK